MEPTLLLSAPPAVDGFRADAASAVDGVRHAVRHLIGSFPERVTTAAAFRRAIGLDYNLCWHLFKILKAGDPLEAARHVPGEFALRKLAVAAEQKGVSSEVIADLRAALARFDATVKQHATDRSAFKAMASSFAGDEAAEGMLLQQRRAAFKANSQLCGAQITTSFNHVVVRRADGDDLTMALLTARLGFQRLRPEAKPVVFSSRFYDKHAAPVPNQARPLRPEPADTAGASLLPAFCTTPVPRMARVEAETGWVYYVLETEQLGRRGAVDVVRCLVYPHGTLTDVGGGRRKLFYTTSQSQTPTEEAVLEVALHRASFTGVRPYFRAIPIAGVNFLAELTSPVPQLPTYERVDTVGSVDRVPGPSGIPRYRDLLTHVYSGLNWDPAEFDLYRVCVPFPLLHTGYATAFDVDT